jgi:hypothetical protein
LHTYIWKVEVALQVLDACGKVGEPTAESPQKPSESYPEDEPKLSHPQRNVRLTTTRTMHVRARLQKDAMRTSLTRKKTWYVVINRKHLGGTF